LVVAKHDIIVVGTSAGRVEAFSRLVRGLPSGFPASFFIMCHWTAVRTFREKPILARQLANHVRAEGNVESADRFDEQSRQAARYGSLIRQYLLNGNPEDGDGVGTVASDSVL